MGYSSNRSCGPNRGLAYQSLSHLDILKKTGIDAEGHPRFTAMSSGVDPGWSPGGPWIPPSVFQDRVKVPKGRPHLLTSTTAVGPGGPPDFNFMHAGSITLTGW